MSRNKAKNQSHNAKMRLKRAARLKGFKFIFAPSTLPSYAAEEAPAAA